MSNKSYLIVNETELIDINAFELGMVIPQKNRPDYLHLNKDQALNEITRLKYKYPECHFVLYESIAEYKENSHLLTDID